MKYFRVILCIVFLTLVITTYSFSASNSDMRQAEQFIDSLPVGCSNSYITTRSDGTVVINLRCKNGNDIQNGVIEIKDGVVRQIN